MTKKTRLIILIVCVACFLAIAPILIAYSEGYRFDFQKRKIVVTGGIYVRTFPTADLVTIDSKISAKPGLFLNHIFVQGLLPNNHTVSIKKSGYYDYFKNLPVQENEVTKLENVLLFKKNVAFKDLSDKIDYFSIAPNNQNIITAAVGAKITTFAYFSLNSTGQKITFSTPQIGNVSDIKWTDDSSRALIHISGANNDFYYLFDTTLPKPVGIRLSYLDTNSQQISFDPQDSQTIFYIKNKTLYSAKGNSSLPIINNIVSFQVSGTNILWLSTKGTLSYSDLSGNLISKTSLQDFPINIQKKYAITSINGNTYLQESSSLFKFNQTKKIFDGVIIPLTNYKIIISPDNKNLIYWNSGKIYLYSFADEKFTQLYSGSQINNLQWINNDYIIFTDGNKIIISEIDYRGNINTVTFPSTLKIGNNTTSNIISPQTFFDPQDGKLYILTQNTLLSSDKITP